MPFKVSGAGWRCGRGLALRGDRLAQRHGVFARWNPAAVGRRDPGRYVQRGRTVSRCCSQSTGASGGEAFSETREHLLRPGGALCELLKTKDVYDVMHPTTQLPYDRAKLRVVRGGLAPKPAADLVGPTAAEFLRDPGRHIIKSDAEPDTSSTPPSKPFWDPRLKNEPGLLDQFVEDLASVGLITWRWRCNSFVGCCFARKNSGRPDQARRRLPRDERGTPAPAVQRPRHSGGPGEPLGVGRVGRLLRGAARALGR